jgi:hypothetical protein
MLNSLSARAAPGLLRLRFRWSLLERGGMSADVSTARPTAVAAPRWTPNHVAERLAEAAEVLDRLPEARSLGLYSLWPLLPDGGDAARTRAAAPSPEAIDRMDEALSWLLWLEPEERRLLWLRAEGLPWKRITHRLGIGRTTAWQRWTMALLKISIRLNAADEQNRPNNKTLNRRAGPVLQGI